MDENGFPNVEPYDIKSSNQQSSNVQTSQSNGLAIAALVCGIISFLTCMCCGLGLILAIAAIICAVLSRKNNGGQFDGMALTGLIIAIISAVINVWILVSIIYGAFMYDGVYTGFDNFF